jgi:hypothetical protein
MIGMNRRCVHGNNPVACLPCYHAPKPVEDKPRERAFGQNGIPLGMLPGQSGGAVVGDRTGAMIGEKISGQPEVSPEERAKHRGERPAVKTGNAEAPVAPKEPFSSAVEDGKAFDPNVLWEPPTRPEVINRQPRHPEAGK